MFSTVDNLHYFLAHSTELGDPWVGPGRSHFCNLLCKSFRFILNSLNSVQRMWVKLTTKIRHIYVPRFLETCAISKLRCANWWLPICPVSFETAHLLRNLETARTRSLSILYKHCLYNLCCCARCVQLLLWWLVHYRTRDDVLYTAVHQRTSALAA